MRLRIDESLCTGHGRCYALAPQLFDADDRGYGVVTCAVVPDALVGQAQTAQQNCPERAVFLEDD
jgi:ferredoxin